MHAQWRRSLLTPAPSVEWDPSRKRPAPLPATANDLTITLMLPEDAALEVRAPVGSTLLDALEAADLSDVWDTRGACGGACSCSTCRVVVVSAPTPLQINCWVFEVVFVIIVDEVPGPVGNLP